jgi:hypothetical protein
MCSRSRTPTVDLEEVVELGPTLRKKKEPSISSELVELVNYNDIWIRTVNG